jgi:hypothetical protein
MSFGDNKWGEILKYKKLQTIQATPVPKRLAPTFSTTDRLSVGAPAERLWNRIHDKIKKTSEAYKQAFATHHSRPRDS